MFRAINLICFTFYCVYEVLVSASQRKGITTPQEFVSGSRNDSLWFELVLCFLQWFDIAGQTTVRASGLWKHTPIVPTVSLPEHVE